MRRPNVEVWREGEAQLGEEINVCALHEASH